MTLKLAHYDGQRFLHPGGCEKHVDRGTVESHMLGSVHNLLVRVESEDSGKYLVQIWQIPLSNFWNKMM